MLLSHAPLRMIFANQGDTVETIILQGVHDLHEVPVTRLLVSTDEYPLLLRVTRSDLDLQIIA